MPIQPALAVIKLSFLQVAENKIPAQIYTPYQTDFRLILNLKLSTVCLHISLFDLSLIQSSHRLMPSKLALCNWLLQSKTSRGTFSFFFPPCLFHFTIRVTCWRVLHCPVATRDISSDMITANGCCRDWVTGNAPTLYLDFALHCLLSDLESRQLG